MDLSYGKPQELIKSIHFFVEKNEIGEKNIKLILFKVAMFKCKPLLPGGVNKQHALRTNQL